MRTILAGVLSVAVVVFTIGSGTYFLYYSEAEAVAYSETAELLEHHESFNEKAMRGLFLMAIGGAVVIFVIMLDEARHSEEKKRQEGFFA